MPAVTKQRVRYCNINSGDKSRVHGYDPAKQPPHTRPNPSDTVLMSEPLPILLQLYQFYGYS